MIIETRFPTEEDCKECPIKIFGECIKDCMITKASWEGTEMDFGHARGERPSREIMEKHLIQKKEREKFAEKIMSSEHVT